MPHLHLAPAADESVERSGSSSIRVVLADDHPLMRHSLRLLLEAEEGVEVIAEAGDLATAGREVARCRPDVLVLDLRLPGDSSVEQIGDLRRRAPGVQVVVLTMHDNPVFAQHALARGAQGFVLKDLADHELPHAVRAAARGEEYVSPLLAAGLMALRRSLAEAS